MLCRVDQSNIFLSCFFYLGAKSEMSEIDREEHLELGRASAVNALFVSINHSVEVARLLQTVSKTLFREAQINVKPNTCVRCGMSVYKKCAGELSGELPCWRACLHERCWRKLGALPVIVDVLGRAHTMWHAQLSVARRSVKTLRERSPRILILKAVADAVFIISLLLLLPLPRHRAVSLRQISRFYACKRKAGLRRLRT
jgi:hypothetical protein